MARHGAYRLIYVAPHRQKILSDLFPGRTIDDAVMARRSSPHAVMQDDPVFRRERLKVKADMQSAALKLLDFGAQPFIDGFPAGGAPIWRVRKDGTFKQAAIEQIGVPIIVRIAAVKRLPFDRHLPRDGQ